MTSRFARRAATVAASAAGLSLLIAAPAMAAVPEGWSDPDPMSTTHFLMLTLVIPIVSAIVIVVLCGLPGFLKGEGFTGGQKPPAEGPSSARHSAH